MHYYLLWYTMLCVSRQSLHHQPLGDCALRRGDGDVVYAFRQMRHIQFHHLHLRRYWAEKLRERIRADRASCRKTGQDFPLYYAIDQNDSYDGFCRCAACREIFEREGSNAGILLDFANFVAAFR